VIEALTIADLAGGAALGACERAGMSRGASTDKAAMFARAAEALKSAGAEEGARIRAFFVPGRIEVLGKHTDYAGGRSIVAAVEKGFCVVAAGREDAEIRIVSVGDGRRAQFLLRPDLAPEAGEWSNYPMTAALRVARNFPGRLRGADVAFESDLPVAAGMSSSSAMMVATFLVLSAVNDLPAREEYRREIHSPEDLAGYLGTVENGQSFGSLAGDKGVGTFGGSEDHTAMLCCRAGMLSQYSYCPVRLEKRIAVPKGNVFAVASSGVAAEKTGAAMAKYNRASRLALAVVDVWNESTGRGDAHLAAALKSDQPPAAAARMREILMSRAWGEFAPSGLAARFGHFFAESEEIIPAAGTALENGDVESFGQIVGRSQELAESLLRNQVPQTVFLARSARRIGATAASAFGAGFGGSVWAMVRQERTEEFLAAWKARYAERVCAEAKKAAFFATCAGPATFELSGGQRAENA